MDEETAANPVVYCLRQLDAAHERSIKIGSDLAVVGFDGVQDVKHSEPPLTTLDIPIFDIARQLVDMLLKSFDGEKVITRVLIKACTPSSAIDRWLSVLVGNLIRRHAQVGFDFLNSIFVI
jgi:hypothetical protein